MKRSNLEIAAAAIREMKSKGQAVFSNRYNRQAVCTMNPDSSIRINVANTIVMNKSGLETLASWVAYSDYKPTF